jgi:hypothetical protein
MTGMSSPTAPSGTGRWAPLKASLVVVGALLLVFVTTAASGEHPNETVRGNLLGQQVRLSLPGGDAKPKGLVIWFHGQGGNVNDRVDGPWLDSLRRDGWAIASSEFHSQSWGNPASTRDAAALVDWAEQITGSQARLWVSGSMGGSIVLNAITHGVAAPPCWYGVKPAISLKQMDNVPGGPRFIADAFGGDVPADRNPVQNLDKLPVDMRYRIVSSRQDQWVMWDENTRPLYRKLTARGAEVSLLTVTGLHDDPSHFNARDLVDFANSCLEG